MRKVIFMIIKLLILAVALVIGINVFVIQSMKAQIAFSYDGTKAATTDDAIEELKAIQPQCILVLGASVNPDGTPSQMLQDRLDTGIALYRAGVAPKLLLSGDDGQVEYNEVEGMRTYAVKAGVPEEDIFLDHAGFSTYESVYRAGSVFGVERMIVVTQRYHLYRSLYGCKRMGITALGAAADQDTYLGQELREVREILARDKDCVKWIIKPEPTYLGEEIPIDGDGTSTH